MKIIIKTFPFLLIFTFLPVSFAILHSQTSILPLLDSPETSEPHREKKESPRPKPKLDIKASMPIQTDMNGFRKDYFTVEAKTKPEGILVIIFRPSDLNQAEIVPSQIRIDSKNWRQIQRIRVTGKNDHIFHSELGQGIQQVPYTIEMILKGTESSGYRKLRIKPLPAQNEVEAYLMFQTRKITSGNLGNGSFSGIMGADAICSDDPNNPKDANYRAFLVDGVERVACLWKNCRKVEGKTGSVNWVLRPNSNYFQHDSDSDYPYIMTTNQDAIFPFHSGKSLFHPFSKDGPPYWTGIEYSDWTPSTDNCEGYDGPWTHESCCAKAGIFGRSGSQDYNAIGSNHAVCNEMYSLICVSGP